MVQLMGDFQTMAVATAMHWHPASCLVWTLQSVHTNLWSTSLARLQ
jgi:hypothetical protein